MNKKAGVIMWFILIATVLAFCLWLPRKQKGAEITETAPKAVGPQGTLNIPVSHEQRIQKLISEAKDMKAAAEKAKKEQAEKEAEEEKMLQPRIQTLKKIASCSGHRNDYDCEASMTTLSRDNDIVVVLKKISESGVKIKIYGYEIQDVQDPKNPQIFLDYDGVLIIRAVRPLFKIREFLGL